MEEKKMWNFIMSLEPKEKVVVLSAVLAAVVNIVIAIKNGFEQSKWNKKKIDADLKAKARIDWIQKVREHTADLLSTYYAILNETDKEKQFHLIQIAKKNSEILSLYFGDCSEKTPLYDSKILENPKTNKDKNPMIVLSIESLFDKFNKYYKDELNETRLKLHESFRRANQEMTDNPIGWAPCGVYETPDGELVEEKEPLYDPNLKENVDHLRLQIINYENSVLELKQELNELRNHIRLYLKIEWDIAKKGK